MHRFATIFPFKNYKTNKHGYQNHLFSQRPKRSSLLFIRYGSFFGQVLPFILEIIWSASLVKYILTKFQNFPPGKIFVYLGCKNSYSILKHKIIELDSNYWTKSEKDILPSLDLSSIQRCNCIYYTLISNILNLIMTCLGKSSERTKSKNFPKSEIKERTL